jgi:hypothetical protein
MASTVKIRIKPGGKVEVKVQGVTGPTCTDVTKSLQKALGNTINDQKTEEFYKEQDTNKVSQY